ncbi:MULTISPECIES: phospho-sugar mutase [Sphingobacterium]|uniref:phospho-sugar mutase n=1 Tax=Sphingobacterium TaxID=28453 RepID=UPI00104BF03A|nr:MULTISPECIES: phospho-sugar mutase [Sphingobacterium]MCW2261755.1 phosphoglucomutase [Sphingobacterium kitahiroshimense]NJI75485.1 phospho-sugar mutase [Sphingobacterium sp. B16(2022)]TCR10065.1 phosphoglucomutase [Sphingobacterium sp. JUb78]
MNSLDQDLQAKVNQWLSSEYDEATRAALQILIDNNEVTELTDSFYKDLEFGTGGLRGIMGVGSNRINKYTIGKATQGLANYLKKQFPNQVIKVAVAYDSRNNSQSLGKLVADVFAANGIQVYLFNELRPTPVLSFAIRHFACQSGVMLTASHNPKEYNGYKAYWNDGCQLTAPHDINVITEVNAIHSVSQISFQPIPENIIPVGDEIDEIYINENKKLSIHPEAVEAQKDLKIVFSPIHGTGITIVPKLLEAWGFNNVSIVEEQATPDGNFPTVIYPNPEEEDAMALAKRKGEELDADLVLATDPDADRVGIAVKNDKGSFQLLNGNQIGSLLVYYVLSSKKEQNQLNNNPYVVKTIVTTNLQAEIANHFNVPYYETLTGFKYIGELMTKLGDSATYLVGGEESYGYLVGSLVRDKDAPNACAFLAEMTAYYKSKGKSLYEVLLDLYQEFGCYQEKLVSLTKKGKAGAEEIKAMMSNLRANLPKSLGGIAVVEVRDYENSVAIDIATGTKTVIDLPKSDVLQFITVDGDVISARPSGTEPKIKFYCSVKAPLTAKSHYEQLQKELATKVDRMMADII